MFYLLLNHIRPYLFPALCAYCKTFLQQTSIFCGECETKIFPIVSKKIDITPTFSMTVFAISDYKDPLKKLILAKGWSDTTASYHLGKLICQKIPFDSIDADILVPIPLHWTRYAWRGFNQAQEIARVISKEKNIPFHNLLKRIKKTPFQSMLPASMRSNNVKNAFMVSKYQLEEYKDKHIVLVDDLMTTGATVRAAAKALLTIKPKKITVIVACRTI